jgi:hypothetical protein
MRTFRVFSALVICFLMFSLNHSPAHARTKSPKQRKVQDSVAVPLIPELSTLQFSESDLTPALPLTAAKGDAAGGGPYQKVLASVLAPQAGCLLPEQALIIHFATWDAFGGAGPFVLNSSNWYVYHALSQSSRMAAAKVKTAKDAGSETVEQVPNCQLEQARLNADDTARLYGDRSAILLTLDVFTPKASPNTPAVPVGKPLNLVYKISVTPAAPANVQDLAMLAGALLNLTLPAAVEGAAPPIATYCAVAKIKGFKRLPYNFNIAFTFTLPKASGPPVVRSDANSQGGTVGPPPPPAAPEANVPAVAPSTPVAGGGTQKPGGQSPSTPASGQTGPTVVDCSATDAQTPCSFSHTFKSEDKEWWDISIGVTTPGVREATYAGNASKPPTITTHTNLYAIFDLLPFAKWYGKDDFAPRLNVGLPVTGKTFYRPYFGLSENLTGRWRSFPVQLNVFAGVVYMKQSIAVPGVGGSSPTLQTDRVLKGLYGIEVPISSIISKIGGGKSK